MNLQCKPTDLFPPDTTVQRKESMNSREHKKEDYLQKAQVRLNKLKKHTFYVKRTPISETCIKVYSKIFNL